MPHPHATWEFFSFHNIFQDFWLKFHVWMHELSNVCNQIAWKSRKIIWFACRLKFLHGCYVGSVFNLLQYKKSLQTSAIRLIDLFSVMSFVSELLTNKVLDENCWYCRMRSVVVPRKLSNCIWLSKQVDWKDSRVCFCSIHWKFDKISISSYQGYARSGFSNFQMDFTA